MKVGVLTFHRCINYGSYWQARCLVEGLRGMGHDARLLDHDDVTARRAEWRNAFQPRLPVRTTRNDIAGYGAKARRFLAAFDALPQTPRFDLNEPWRAEPQDAIVIGSDEVWNFSHPWYGWKPAFFGDFLPAGRRIAYAASFGSHDAARGIHPDWAAKLARFDAISVRDANSRELVQASTGRDPTVVLDPVLQFPPAEPEAGARGGHVAVYGHGFPDWFVGNVRAWASQRGLRLVSIGYRNDWADESVIDLAPEAFPAQIAGAAAVTTNFFHGCVFALRFGRPFVCAVSDYRRNKLRDLTDKLGAARHLVDATTEAGDYSALLDAPLDLEIAGRIAQLREQSGAFLATALG
ncbi:polysaccharide pyruvyl transferase family protein [Sphingomonas turrisvirgatae]|uniref:Polysaccharide pyruvyl transferase n=1 Tax=Sphingomonas turrisvirgatae TaxID=1888892 RepID=A0A1E3LRT0_9SPHN|nr:polysaccharide pyruvyl transferase family protein [Sphingomonas turrisvirgatae]ODP36456.1 polysaccharide pyruvyl transferase [Sphingomonas turrisvirgatae]